MGLIGGNSISAAAVFLQGILSFFSPCVLPLIPVYAAYLAGGASGKRAPEEAQGAGAGVLGADAGSVGNRPDVSRRRRLLVNTLFFVLGISFSFFLLGLGMTSLGRAFAARRELISKIGAVIIMLLGLYQLGVFGDSELLSRERRLPVDISKLSSSPLSALIAGFVFSFSWTPCVGPALSSVLLMAGSAESRAAGLALTGIYSLGFCLPFAALGLFADGAIAFFRRNRGFSAKSAKIGGALMLAVGILMFSGELGRLSGALSGGYGVSAGRAGTAASEQAADPERGADAVTGGEAGTGDTQAGTDGAEAGAGGPKSGSDAPESWADMNFTDQYGETHRISDYSDKVVFLNFWATWCPPCRAEMPDIQELYEELEADERSEATVIAVAFPGMSGEGSADDISDFLEENGYSYPVLMDPDGVLAREFGISAFPTTFMIKKGGEVYGYAVGGLDKASMENIIEQTLNASGSKGEKAED